MPRDGLPDRRAVAEVAARAIEQHTPLPQRGIGEDMLDRAVCSFLLSSFPRPETPTASNDGSSRHVWRSCNANASDLSRPKRTGKARRQHLVMQLSFSLFRLMLTNQPSVQPR